MCKVVADRLRPPWREILMLQYWWLGVNKNSYNGVIFNLLDTYLWHFSVVCGFHLRFILQILQSIFPLKCLYNIPHVLPLIDLSNYLRVSLTRSRVHINPIKRELLFCLNQFPTTTFDSCKTTSPFLTCTSK